MPQAAVPVAASAATCTEAIGPALRAFLPLLAQLCRWGKVTFVEGSASIVSQPSRWLSP